MNPPPQKLTVTIEPALGGERLDRALATMLADLSRSRIKALIEQDLVALAEREGQAAVTIDDPSYRVKPGQFITVSVPAPEAATPRAQDIPLTVVYEDDDIIVVDKPAGMVVHPAPGNPDNTLVNALIAHCGDSLSGIGGVRRPGIVHRIDKDTSGLLIAAKNDLAHHALTAAFAKHDIERVYQCVVWGVPSPKQGQIEGNIGRHPKDRKRMTVRRQGGKAALTSYAVKKVLAKGGASLIECRLATGRTHQIRVHLASIGHPLIGDSTYGRASPARRQALPAEAAKAAAAFPRQALHAAILGLTHPRTGKAHLWSSELPADVKNLLNKLNG